MSHFETLMARDGHSFRAYMVSPPSHARGAVIIVHEVFGLTAHIRTLTDSYAAEGYLAIAPALFDRVRRDLVLGDTPEELEQGRGYRQQIGTDKAVLDIAASVAVARHSGKVAVVGYCWGGCSPGWRLPICRWARRSATTAAASPRISTRHRSAPPCCISASTMN